MTLRSPLPSRRLEALGLDRDRDACERGHPPRVDVVGVMRRSGLSLVCQTVRRASDPTGRQQRLGGPREAVAKHGQEAPMALPRIGAKHVVLDLERDRSPRDEREALI